MPIRSGKELSRGNNQGFKSSKYFKRVLLWTVASVVAGIAGLWIWSGLYRKADHTATIVSARSRLVHTEEKLLPDSAGKKRIAFELTDERGRRTRGELHLPAGHSSKLPGLLILGGKGTGARAAGLIRLTRPAALCSMDYPAFETKKITLRDSPAFITGMREASLDAVGGTFNVLDYLCARGEVDTSRITVVGASLGVPFAVISSSLDQRVNALVLVYGAGDLDHLIDWNLRRKLKFTPARLLVSRILSTAAAPFEPSAYIGRLAPRPLLMVNSRQDERIPEPCIRHLFSNAGQPKTIRWLATAHIHPTNRELIDSLTETVSGWLEENGLL